MMTAQSPSQAVLQMQKNDAVGKLQDEQARSESKTQQHRGQQAGSARLYRLRCPDASPYERQIGTVDEIVEAYKIRLAVTERTVKNPTGLYIAEYTATQIHGEQRHLNLTMEQSQNNDDYRARQLPSARQ